MLIRKILRITWPAFLAASLLQLVVFAIVDPLELHWFGRELAWSRQAVYAMGSVSYTHLTLPTICSV